ncbi:MAG: DUF3782 domain-containing protein, partial [Caldilineaceae bacterium]|nr:DUF3782 domain-containing protein [Caldilineaceae bacterium]
TTESMNAQPLTTEQLEQAKQYILKSLPQILEQSPEFVVFVEGVVADKFPRRDEFARLLDQVEAHRRETQQFQKETGERFDKVDEQLESLGLTLARLGSRWGIHSEDLFRKTMKSVLEESFEATVEEKNIQGEQFDLVVMKNGDHILIEIAASVRRNILERLDRKKALYISEVGIVPARIILAVGTINSRSAQIIRDAGFEVVEPDDDFYGEE